MFAAVEPEEPAAVSLLDASGKAVATIPRQTSSATLTGERKTTGPEIWSLDVKPVEDVKVWLGNSVLPILASDSAAGLELQ